MPKVAAAVKIKKNSQYDTSRYGRAKGFRHVLANRRARHQARLALVRCIRGAE